MRRSGTVLWAALACALVAAGACSDAADKGAAPTVTASGSAAPADSAGGEESAPPVVRTRSGSSIAMTMAGDALIVASEDHKALFRVALPFSSSSKVERIEMPGAPAQVVALADRVLVTVRDPGLLVEMAPGEGGRLVEKRKAPLATDAWGVAVTPDGRTAVVTSAWTHTVSGVDLGSMTVTWTKEVAREPRGALVLPDGKRAYVSHLMGTALTRIDGIDSDAPTVKEVDLAPAPSRTPAGKSLSASLGYALASDPEGKRVYAPRHALGALGAWQGAASWWGATTVDVLRTVDDAGVAAAKNGPKAVVRATARRSEAGLRYDDAPMDSTADSRHAPSPGAGWGRALQPRAAVYRRRTHTLLVAGEGDGTVVEFDAHAVEPALLPLRIYRVATDRKKPLVMPETGGAPSGIVLDEKEENAYVFGRSTYDVTAISLSEAPEKLDAFGKVGEALSLAEDPLLDEVSATDPKRKSREVGAWGRRLFYMGNDSEMSADMACASCHPEGRDDGYTWHFYDDHDGGYLLAAPEALEAAVDWGGRPREKHPSGKPRQTPMLAGRVSAVGPYGWLGESETLEARVELGFVLHHGAKESKQHALIVAAFVRQGLTPPPKVTRALTPEEEQGKKVFTSNETGCTACHDPATAYTDRKPVAVKVLDRPGYKADDGAKFKTPSLAWVVGTPPYFHNGSASSLDALVRENGDRMGKTDQLSTTDRAALIAFLKTL